ncbi:hypothetical protein CR513_15682, partial [Mucuna pruriens]
MRPLVFRKGDMVLKQILPNVKDQRGKWAPNYEEPYMVKQAFSRGALILTDAEGKMFQGVEARYQKIEKATFALIIMTKRLRPYFQSHIVVVKTNLPIKQILRKLDLVGRINSTLLLIKEDILRPRCWKISSTNYLPSKKPIRQKNTSENGESNQKVNEAGIIFEGPEGVLIEQSLHFNFKTSNNQVEYEVLLAGMRLAEELGAKVLITKSDSQLVKDPQLAKCWNRAKSQAATFEKFTLIHVLQEQNERADLLSSWIVIQETLSWLTIEATKVLCVDKQSSWMDPSSILAKRLGTNRPQKGQKTQKKSIEILVNC